jgi:hypothetical protein
VLHCLAGCAAIMQLQHKQAGVAAAAAACIAGLADVSGRHDL